MEEKNVYAEISSIRSIMERSTKFISLSGLSGIMAGVYALLGAAVAYKLIYINPDHSRYAETGPARSLITQLAFVAIVVLVLAISTALWLTIRKSKAQKQQAWNQSSKYLLKSGILPLLTGGIFVVILLFQGHVGIIAPGCLIFYGLSLAAASTYTYNDIRWLGISEIILGLLATIFPGYGLFFWAAGFGVLHILYGSVMYFKYDRENSVN